LLSRAFANFIIDINRRSPRFYHLIFSHTLPHFMRKDSRCNDFSISCNEALSTPSALYAVLDFEYKNHRQSNHKHYNDRGRTFVLRL